MFARRWTREAAAHDQGVVAEFGGRLTSDPNRSSLGLLPSGPDPVGEWLVHRQPPAPYIGPTGRESKRAAGVIHAGLFAASDRLLPRGTGAPSCAPVPAMRRCASSWTAENVSPSRSRTETCAW